MPHRPNLLFALALCALPIACSPAIDLPTPEELKVKQIVGAPAPQVELSWKLIIRVDGYLVHYRAGSAGPPWDGAGLAIVPWPEGCGDLDAGTAKGSDAFTTIATEAGAADAGSDAAPDNGSHDKGAPDTGIADTGAPDKGAPDQGPSDLNAPDKAATPDSEIGRAHV